MAAMLWALREERAILKKLPYEIWFAGLVGEEAGQHGAKALAAQEQFDFVIVGEPTQMQVVHTHKGSAWISLTTGGRAVHASMPEKGDNAIYKMADLLACIRDEIAPSLGGITNAVLGSPTISAGTISGGSKVNIVPDICHAKVDVRTVPGQKIDPILEALRARVPEVGIEFTESFPLHTDPGLPLIQRLGSCGAGLAGAPWFCDAAVFAAAGMPSVAMGPGSIAQAHTADEFIDIAELERGALFFQTFLRSLINE
jgi:acetylornithine deacetylase/succinyl-diaminopimelate desuccinylase-like protein